MKKSSNSTSIRVFCRLRPLNRLEREQGGECCVQHTDQAIKVKVAGVENPYDFSFDGIFGHDSNQIDVFNKVAKPVIDGLIEGYNGTIFAYGQTSSGKTFTMEGPDVIDSDAALGIIPRMMNYLFNLIMNSSEDIEFSVKVSFLELYNEKVQDLIDPRKNNLQIKEDKNKGIFVQDATEVYVSSAEQMRQVHKSGSENRTMAATRMNERSSRSHSVFVLYVQQKDTKTETTKHSKLYFVDLAGSEKISKTNVTGQQLEEAKNINKSLTALGLVINALTEKDKAHVPYRDSKLTRLLQESLGGNSQTSLILACSMCTYNDKETVDTLRFGNRAKSIKNAPIVNAERSAKELTMLLNAAEKKIRDQEEFISNLQQQLDGAPGTPVSKRPTISKDAEAEGKVEEKQPEDEKDSTSNDTKPEITQKAPKTGGASSSLALLKNQIELEKLKEEFQELKAANKELENELSARNHEIYGLNGKILQYENQISEFSSKNVLAIEEYQVQFEKLYHENQEKAMLATKFKRAIHRLKSDLNFISISKHLKVLEHREDSSASSSAVANDREENNKDELIVSSIQKTIEILEEIERDINDNEKKGTSNEEMENLIDALMKSSPTNSNKDMNKDISPITFATDLLISNADDDIKGMTWMTESSTENKETLDMSDNYKLDGENEDDLAQKIQVQFQSLSEEDKTSELQSLVTNQRKTISNLSKLNAELTQTNQKLLVSQDKNVQAYKAKLEELQKFNVEKIKEYDTSIQRLKSSLEAKINELEATKGKYEKSLVEKAQSVAELKQQNGQLQNLIAGNDAAKRNYELENTLKEVITERKQLAEDIMTLRKEADEKDDIITQKTSQIELLQNNIGLAAKEIKMLKQYKPQNVDINPVRAQEKEYRRDGKSGNKNKTEFSLFDKHVVKPIRGGGGDANNFARNNFLTFDKPTKNEFPGEEKRSTRAEAKTPSSGLLGSPEEFKSTKTKEEQNDSRRQRGNSNTSKVKISGGQNVDISSKDDGEIEVQQKLKALTAKGVATGQKHLKSLMGNVKNLFS